TIRRATTPRRCEPPASSMSPGYYPARSSQPSATQPHSTLSAGASHHEADNHEWQAYSAAIGHRRRTSLAATLTGCALVWVLVVLAGIYTVTLVPAAILLAISATLLTPRVAAPSTRTLDVALLACGGLVVLQCIPMP